MRLLLTCKQSALGEGTVSSHWQAKSAGGSERRDAPGTPHESVELIDSPASHPFGERMCWSGVSIAPPPPLPRTPTPTSNPARPPTSSSSPSTTP